jgi:NAD(P)-dependent dehydrogenase (short-subunit alcohol dehydrogenase family)
MKGRLCIVTGATSGIGRATALALGELGADLVLIGRDAGRGACVAAEVARRPGAGRVEFIRADLSSQAEVRAAAAQIVAAGRPIHLLVNNAGARHDQSRRSVDGLELTFATNHVGHFLLTALLLERLLADSAPRIITVSSGSHFAAKPEDILSQDTSHYDRRKAYAASKLANVLFAYELARRLAGAPAVSVAIDPGGVASNFARNNGLVRWLRHLMSHVLRRDLISSRTAAQDILWTASDPSVVSGGYYYRRQTRRSSPASYDTDAARKLWAISLSLTGLAPDAKLPRLLTSP